MFDFILIGGGIIGLSTAWQLQQVFPGKSIALLEKEAMLAVHQTGHNSGVIHAGVYYQPGSMKARFCRQGNQATRQFCDAHKIPYIQCGKMLVATNYDEQIRMTALEDLATRNGVEVERLSAGALREHEPNISGVEALRIPATSITSFPAIAQKLGELFQRQGGTILLGTRVTGLEERSREVVVETARGVFTAGHLISCAGLHSDRTVRMLGLHPAFRIIPFRGEYFRLTPRDRTLINHLIYPIPDPRLPFLGVHLTRMIDGSVSVGPNAVLALKREGYGKYAFSPRDSWETFTYPGFYRTLSSHLKPAIAALWSSISKRSYLKSVQRYCPNLRPMDLEPYPAGVRAQAITPNGALIDDFLFSNTKRTINLCNAPSPAATSALPIGGHIVREVKRMVDDRVPRHLP